MTDPIPCPADLAAGEEPNGDRTCGGWFDTENGAVMHAVNKKDTHHERISAKPEAYAALAEAEASGPDPGSGSDDGDDPGDDPGDGGGRLTAEIPEADDAPPAEPDTADCPNCGADLGHTEAEVEEFIDDHGRAFCDSCGARIRRDDGGEP
jgi:hypothetical protein